VVKDIAIYVEGGGDTTQTLDPIRRGMSAFLKSVVDAVRQRRIRWRIIPCGGRGLAYRAFVDALENEPEVFNMLLVDSEDPVAITVSPWDHLKGREGDKDWQDNYCRIQSGVSFQLASNTNRKLEAYATYFLADPKWEQPAGTDDACCQMMVACMEAWFLADPAGLKKHYGGNFNERALPPANQAETRTKDNINAALRKAVRPTPAKEYHKIRDGAKLLEKVDPAEVRKHCKWCDRLFHDLGKAIGATV
jgi:hypothetical protein